uniref:Uncharacterized protein n=4 Tax=unclassified Prevotella TaxID=2638335 RepID=A0AB33JKY9_9BACT
MNKVYILLGVSFKAKNYLFSTFSQINLSFCFQFDKNNISLQHKYEERLYREQIKLYHHTESVLQLNKRQEDESNRSIRDSKKEIS